MSDEQTASRVGRKPTVAMPALIHTAWELFERDGYDATTMTAIATKIGVSRRTLFNHVSSKEALLFPGIEQYMEEFTNRLLQFPSDSPILNTMMKVVRELQVVPDHIDPALNGPKVKQARLRPEAVTYIKELSARWMHKAVVEWLGDDADNRIKAAVVSALVAQVTTEVARIQTVESVTAEQALAKAMEVVRDVLQ